MRFVIVFIFYQFLFSQIVLCQNFAKLYGNLENNLFYKSISYNSHNYVIGTSNDKAFISKIDENGILIWSRILTETSRWRDLVQYKDKIYLIGNYGPNAEKSLISIINTNSGDFISNKSYDFDPLRREIALDITIDMDANTSTPIIVSGIQVYRSPITDFTFIMKLDENGNMLDRFYFDPSVDDHEYGNNLSFQVDNQNLVLFGNHVFFGSSSPSGVFAEISKNGIVNYSKILNSGHFFTANTNYVSQNKIIHIFGGDKNLEDGNACLVFTSEGTILSSYQMNNIERIHQILNLNTNNTYRALASSLENGIRRTLYFDFTVNNNFQITILKSFYLDNNLDHSISNLPFQGHNMTKNDAGGFIYTDSRTSMNGFGLMDGFLIKTNEEFSECIKLPFNLNFNPSNITVSDFDLIKINSTTNSGVSINSELIQYNSSDFCACDTLYNDLAYFICQGKSITLNNQTYFSPGEYTQALTSQNGCDSILQIEISIIKNCACLDSTLCFAKKKFPEFQFEIEKLLQSSENVSVYQSPLLADMDGDCIPEIIVSATNQFKQDPLITTNILILNSETGATKNTINTPFYATSCGTSFVIGDVDGDGSPEIILAVADVPENPNNQRGRLICYSTNGTIKWISSTKYGKNAPFSYGASPSLADFNKDGKPEVYVYNEIFNATTGQFLADGGSNNGIGLAHAASISGSKATSMAGELNNELSSLELAAGYSIYKVNIINGNGSSGNTMLPINYSLNGETIDGFTSLADINTDGKLDVIVAAPATINSEAKLYVYTMNNNSATLLAQTFPPYVGDRDYIGPPFIGDVDGNDKPTIGITRPGLMLMYSFDGSQILQPKWQKNISDNSGSTGITMFDFNQDGKNEIVFRDEKTLSIFNGEGNEATTLASFNCSSGTGYEIPIIGDIDNTGNSKICVTCGLSNSGINTRIGKLEVFSAPKEKQQWAPSRGVWNQYNYNALNINDDLTVPFNLRNNATFQNGKFNNFFVQASLLDSAGAFLQKAPDIFAHINCIEYNTTTQRFYVSFSIGNLSMASAATPNSTIEISFFNGNPQINGLYLGKYTHSGILNPGDIKDNLAFDLPTSNFDNIYMVVNLKPGTSGVFTDESFGFLECDFANNIFNIQTKYSELIINECNNSSITINNQTYTTSGTYVQHLKDARGCDSTLSVQLLLHETTPTSIIKQICEGQSISLNGQTYSSSGNFTQTLELPNGCDSIIIISITVIPNSESSLTYSLCNQNSITINDQTFTSPGQYLQFLKNINGCDSTIIIDILENNTAITFDFESCNAVSTSQSMNYTEFVPIIAQGIPCGEISSTHIFRENASVNKHSCTQGVDNSLAMCVSSLESCMYIAASDKAIVFETTVTPDSGKKLQLSCLNFYHRSPIQFSWINGSIGINNYPTKFGIRILKDGLEIYRNTDITTTNQWKLESFSFSDLDKFTADGKSIFRFEILTYCVAGITSDVTAWDIDNLSLDISCTSGLNRIIAGNILATQMNDVRQIDIRRDDGIEIKLAYPDQDGKYQILNNSIDKSYKISAHYDKNLLENVSTQDIISIMRHILGLKKFESIEQYIAADVNNSKKIDVADIVELRKAILGLSQKFKNNESWKFLNLNDIHSQIHPFDVKSHYEIEPSPSHHLHINFKGVKIGDVDVDQKTPIRSNEDAKISLHFDPKFGLLKVVSLQDIEADGLQMEIHVNAQLGQLMSRLFEINPDEFTISGGNLKLALIFPKGIHIKENDILFECSLHAVNMPLRMNGNANFNEIYFNNQIIPIHLLFNDNNDKKLSCDISPNPFDEITTINISGDDQFLQLQISNIQGQIVYQQSVNLAGGNINVTLSSNQLPLPGLYFYHLKGKHEYSSGKLSFVR